MDLAGSIERAKCGWRFFFSFFLSFFLFFPLLSPRHSIYLIDFFPNNAQNMQEKSPVLLPPHCHTVPLRQHTSTFNFGHGIPLLPVGAQQRGGLVARLEPLQQQVVVHVVVLHVTIGQELSLGQAPAHPQLQQVRVEAVLLDTATAAEREHLVGPRVAVLALGPRHELGAPGTAHAQRRGRLRGAVGEDDARVRRRQSRPPLRASRCGPPVHGARIRPPTGGPGDAEWWAGAVEGHEGVPVEAAPLALLGPLGHEGRPSHLGRDGLRWRRRLGRGPVAVLLVVATPVLLAARQPASDAA